MQSEVLNYFYCLMNDEVAKNSKMSVKGKGI